MIMGLDRYGYPATHMANTLLANMDTHGDATRQLESTWFEWLNYHPFDTLVAKRLATLYRNRIASMDTSRDAHLIQKLKRKLELTENRSARYAIEHFAR
jgi:hypothetical protein